MKLVKCLLLGSAAGFVALTGAQAADLPVKAKPVEYVKICSLYGAGFYYIPGTDTCIRIGGHHRSEISFNNARGTGIQSWAIGDGNATNTRDRDYFYARQRVFLHTDTRTQTSFGTLRTFSVIRAEVATSVGQAAAAGIIAIDTGIIQWGGFTIGRAGTSYFDGPWAYAYKWTPNGSLGVPDTAGARFVAAYTHQFGNGISATLSLEDNKERKRGNYNGANALSQWGLAPTVDTRGGNTWPEIVGQLRIEQAWGGFHIAGNLVNNHVAYSCGPSGATCTEISGPTPSDKIGGSVNGAFKFNVPTGVNDALYIGGTYSVGSTSSVLAGAGPGFGIYGGSNVAYGSVTGGYLFDSVYDTRTGTGQQLTTSYGGAIAFEHGWNAEWRTSVFGGAQFVDYNATANAILCSKYNGASPSTGTLSNFNSTCNMDMRITGVGSRTFWTPVRDLTIGVEVMWTNHHSGNKGATYTPPAVAGYKPVTAYEVKDQNVFGGMFSVRRFF
jgi:hypothetical protein